MKRHSPYCGTFCSAMALLYTYLSVAASGAESNSPLGSRVGRRMLAGGSEEVSNISQAAAPVAALRDGRRGIIRIYGTYPLSMVSNQTSLGERTQVAGCLLVDSATGQQRVVDAEVTVLDRIFGTEGSIHIDCQDADAAADQVTLRLVDGTEFGRRLNITLMATERKGKLASCAGPLHTDRLWLRPWVEYNTLIGVERFIINVPLGAHIDELFDTRSRDERLHKNAGAMQEHTPWSVGNERLRKFDAPGLEWFEYHPSVNVPYYAQQIVYNACQYRLRYEYDYVMQFDIDEFFMLSADVRPEYINLPQFLDANFPEDAASLTFITVFYPLECRSRLTGLYPFQFSLTDKDLPGAAKVVTRPLAVANMHVHGVLDVSEEWQAKVAPRDWREPTNMAIVPFTKAFVKHIRTWKQKQEDGQVHEPLCTFPPDMKRSGAEWVVSF